MGQSADDNTIEPPSGTPGGSHWIAKYLNTRYYAFPAGITVKAREGWQYPRSDARNKLRLITGQRAYLDKRSSYYGLVTLTGANAHWWVLNDAKEVGETNEPYACSGHVAALYQDELYELTNGRAATAKLQEFGVIFGSRRVVIYIEPTPSADQRITTNTARTHLQINNEPLPWADWATEFRENLPEPIDDLVRAQAAGSTEADHGKSIRERLKSVLDLINVSRYRPGLSGDVEIDDSQLVPCGEPGSSCTAGSSGPFAGLGLSTGSVYAAFEKKGGTRAGKTRSDLFPRVQWVSLKDETRELGDLEDRAARFILDQNLLLINADFRVFEDMTAKLHGEWGGNGSILAVVRDTVHSWFEQALVETVIGVQALRNSREWSAHEIEQALSEESLTTAVMQRYHVQNQVRRELGAKLGRHRASAA
jgi:hypothetical protein